MDPAVITRYADSRQLSNFVLEISTTTPLLYTPHPNGLTIGPKAYLYRPFSIVLDGANAKASGKRTATISINNSDNVVKVLATDLSNKGKIVSVTKVHFNEDWTIAGTEPWFYGTIGKPRLVGEDVKLICNAYLGRVGPTPRTLMKDALATHTPPATLTF